MCDTSCPCDPPRPCDLTLSRPSSGAGRRRPPSGQPNAVVRRPPLPHRLWLHPGPGPEALPAPHEDMQGLQPRSATNMALKVMYVHHCAPLCTTVHHCAPLCTTVHHCAPRSSLLVAPCRHCVPSIPCLPLRPPHTLARPTSAARRRCSRPWASLELLILDSTLSHALIA